MRSMTLWYDQVIIWVFFFLGPIEVSFRYQRTGHYELLDIINLKLQYLVAFFVFQNNCNIYSPELFRTRFVNVVCFIKNKFVGNFSGRYMFSVFSQEHWFLRLLILAAKFLVFLPSPESSSGEMIYFSFHKRAFSEIWLKLRTLNRFYIKSKKNFGGIQY